MSVVSSLSRREPLVDSRPAATELPLPLWEIGLACAALFLATDALMPVLFGGGEASTPSVASDPVTRPAWMLVVALMLLALVRSGGDVLAAAAANPGVVALCYLALGSTVWSVAPGVTLSDAVEFSLSTLLGLYVGTRFGVRRLVAILSWTTFAILALSVLFAVALPRYGLDHTRGDAWRGVFVTKNGLGRMMVVGFVVWGVRTCTGEAYRPRNWAILLAFVATALKSDSRTALGVGSLMLGAFVLARMLSRTGRQLVPAKGAIVSALALVAALCVLNLKVMLAVVGSDYSLTGRSGIWRAVWNAIDVRPWLGYGFDAFWRSGGLTFEVWRAAGTQTPHAHNGFLDLLLGLGLAGLACFAVAFAVVWRRALLALREQPGQGGLFPFVYLSLLLLYNLTESSLVGARAFEWVVFAAVAAATAPATSRRGAVSASRTGQAGGTEL